MRVYDVVDLATSGAPPLRHSADDIVRAAVRRRRRRVWATITGGAAAVAATAVAVAVVVPSPVSTDASPEPAGAPPNAVPATAPGPLKVPADPFTFTFTGYEVGRFQVKAPLVASTAYQIAPVVEDSDNGLSAYLVVYRPGAFDPNGLRNPRRLTVAGRPALLQELTDIRFHKLLAWQYLDGAWATLETYSSDPDDPSPDDLERLALALAPANPAPVRLPFRMSYVPAGFKPVVLGSHAMAGMDGVAAAEDGDFGGAVFAKPAPRPAGLTKPWPQSAGPGLPGSFEIFVVPNANSNQQLRGGQRPPTSPRCSATLCNTWTPDGKVNIQIATENGALSKNEMIKVLNGIALASVDNDDTWFDAATAIPVAP
ncbi:hypothetical protein ACTMTJ_07800 [Phytohabitans sp. LJ34]|uniref:hypothetical protein n=1 Tax=Phytohabitans sp. LJ34 TaxID=3452217 RepID=UPI003F8B5F14